MILFAFEAFRTMAAKLTTAADLAPGAFRVLRFENGEMHLDVQSSVVNDHCLICGSIAPPDEQMLGTLLLAHTLKKEGSRRVTAILPYLAYARHDKDKPGESLAIAWTGAMARASGIDDVITVDVHSDRADRLIPIPVLSLSPAEIFAGALRQYGLEEATIVAPDEGAIGRCAAVYRALGTANRPVPHFEKHRTAEGIAHSGLIGEVSRRAVLIDDILDTGGTLLSACEKLGQAGVEEIYVMVTHALFTGTRWKELWGLGVKRIFSTDSIPIPADLDGNIVRMSVIPLLERELRVLSKA